MGVGMNRAGRVTSVSVGRDMHVSHSVQVSVHVTRSQDACHTESGCMSHGVRMHVTRSQDACQVVNYLQ